MTNHRPDITVFSRSIDAASIGPRVSERTIEATAAERVALAIALDLAAINRLVARLTVRRLASGLIEVKGSFEGDVLQACVVTLEPFPASVSDKFRVTFGDTEPEPQLAEIDIDFDDSDPPEPIMDGRIDLGVLLAEQLSLALDPYPRGPDAELPPEYVAAALVPGQQPIHPDSRLERRNPLLGLDKLKK